MPSEVFTDNGLIRSIVASIEAQREEAQQAADEAQKAIYNFKSNIKEIDNRLKAIQNQTDSILSAKKTRIDELKQEIEKSQKGPDLAVYESKNSRILREIDEIKLKYSVKVMSFALDLPLAAKTAYGISIDPETSTIQVPEHINIEFLENEVLFTTPSSKFVANIRDSDSVIRAIIRSRNEIRPLKSTSHFILSKN